MMAPAESALGWLFAVTDLFAGPVWGTLAQIALMPGL